MIKSKILLAVLLALVSSNAIGQNMYGSVGAPTGWGQNLQGTDLVSVDMYTGTGSVNIPIYGYSLGGLDLGVSLAYDAKGVKVDQLASSVGLGWSLRAGGSITREVKGIEDEVTTPAKYSSTDHIEGRCVPGAMVEKYIQNGDPQPIDDEQFDIFHIDLCGRSLEMQFYYDGSTLKYITYPKSEITVEVISKNVASPTTDIRTYASSNVQSGIANGIGLPGGKIMTFNIIDEQGNKFYFEYGDFQTKDYEYTNSLLTSGASGSYLAVDKWDLVKIETYNGFTINYEYKWSYAPFVEDNVLTLQTEKSLTYSGSVGGNNVQGNLQIADKPWDFKTETWFGYKTHINKISYPNGVEVKFNIPHSNETSPSVNVSRPDIPGDFILRDITVESRYDNNCVNAIKYVLNHAFFTTPAYGFTATEVFYNTQRSRIPYYWTGVPAYLDANGESAKHWLNGTRLKLKSIERYGLDGTTKELQYKFDYNPIPLPQRFSSTRDYYGYYNGFTSVPLKLDNLNFVNSPDYNVSNHTCSTCVDPPFDYVYFSVPLDAPLNIMSQDPGTDKTPDYDTMQAWVLNKVTNGMGGSVEIEYTSYSLSNHNNQYKYTAYTMPGSIETTIYGIDNTDLEGQEVNDGLVVGAVKETNIYSHEHDRRIEYTYSGGQRFNRGGYSWYPIPISYAPSTARVYHNFWVSSNSYYNGSNHGFSTVTKEAIGYNNEQLSKTTYHFSNLLYDVGGNTETSMSRRTGYYYHTVPGMLAKHRMGLLEKIETFDEHNNLVGKEEYTYDEVNEKPSVSNIEDIGSGVHFQGPIIQYPPTNAEYYDPSGMIHETYYPINYKLKRLVSKTATTYMKDNSSTQRSMASSTSYTYDANHNVITQTSTDSKGDVYKSMTFYPYHYSDWYPSSLDYVDQMATNNPQLPLSTELWKVNSGNDELISFNCSSPEVINGIVRFPASFSSVTTSPLDEADVFPVLSGIVQPSVILKRHKAVDYAKNNTVTDFGTNLMLTSYASKYDDMGNPIEVWSNEKKEVSSYIWDTRLSKKLAEVANAEYDDIAFTSFEGGTSFKTWNTSDYNKGNWEFDRDYIVYYMDAPDDRVMTGKYAYKLDNGSSIVKSKPLAEKEYMITFWGTGEENEKPEIKLYDGTSFSGNVNYVVSNNTEIHNTVAKAQGRDWHLYVARFTPGDGGHIEISNPNSSYHYYVDELRMHPTDAVMASYSYEPLLGVAATNDASNYIIYTQYDVFGRYFRTWDMRGNILKQVETRIQDADNTTSGGSGGQSGGYSNN